MFDPLDANGGYQTCPGCRRLVDPAAHDTVLAVEIVKLDTIRGRRWFEGPEVAFHESCFPADSAPYRRLAATG